MPFSMTVILIDYILREMREVEYIYRGFYDGKLLRAGVYYVDANRHYE